MTAASPSSVSAADFGTRFSAFVLDAFLLFSGQWILFIVLSRQLQAVGLTSTEPCEPGSVALCEGPNTALWTLLLLLYVVSSVGYHAVLEGRYGATPGKRWMGLRVTDTQGQSPIGLAAGLLRAVVRQLFWLAPLFLFEVSPLSLGLPSALFVLLPALTLSVFILGAFRQDGLAGHDLAARTVVVRTDSVETALEPQRKKAPATAVPSPSPTPPPSPSPSPTPSSGPDVAADDSEDFV